MARQRMERQHMAGKERHRVAAMARQRMESQHMAGKERHRVAAMERQRMAAMERMGDSWMMTGADNRGSGDHEREHKGWVEMQQEN